MAFEPGTVQFDEIVGPWLRAATTTHARIAAAALIISALMVVPGEFLDLNSFVRFASAVLILATVPAVVLMMRRDRSVGILAD